MKDDLDKIRGRLIQVRDQVKAMQADPLLRDETYPVKLRELTYLRRRANQLNRKGKK